MLLHHEQQKERQGPACSHLAKVLCPHSQHSTRGPAARENSRKEIRETLALHSSGARRVSHGLNPVSSCRVCHSFTHFQRDKLCVACDATIQSTLYRNQQRRKQHGGSPYYWYRDLSCCRCRTRERCRLHTGDAPCPASGAPCGSRNLVCLGRAPSRLCVGCTAR